MKPLTTGLVVLACVAVATASLVTFKLDKNAPQPFGNNTPTASEAGLRPALKPDLLPAAAPQTAEFVAGEPQEEVSYATDYIEFDGLTKDQNDAVNQFRERCELWDYTMQQAQAEDPDEPMAVWETLSDMADDYLVIKRLGMKTKSDVVCYTKVRKELGALGTGTEAP